jgi:glycosyltransferase involved in cell wall biosynthesis
MIEALNAINVPAQRVPLGVDLEEWPPSPPLRRECGPARLIHVASLNLVKDQETLLRAMGHLRDAGVDFQLDIVGEDTLHDRIHSIARSTPFADRVRFHGFLTQRQLRPLMERAHVLVMSSRHEAGPLVVLEAAVMGIPTAGTAVGHIKEFAPQAAECVPVGDAQALAHAIHKFLSDEELRFRIASAAHARAVRENADVTAESFEALYVRCCARPALRHSTRPRAS